MDAHEFRRLLGVVETLGVEQRAQRNLHLTAGDDRRAVWAIIEGRSDTQPQFIRQFGGIGRNYRQFFRIAGPAHGSACLGKSAMKQ